MSNEQFRFLIRYLNRIADDGSTGVREEMPMTKLMGTGGKIYLR